MFSPATKKLNFTSQKDRNLGQILPPDSPATPLLENRRSSSYGTSIADRPSTGTPAPWVSRLSVLARIPSAKKVGKGTDADPVQPVYVGEFPEEVRDAQASFLHKSISGDTGISGGVDKGTSLAWMFVETSFLFGVTSHLQLQKNVSFSIFLLPLKMQAQHLILVTSG
ncbi:hypothetical protein GIB67_011202 [Kingdonia uniflora]|uniref:Uncharacterized protein n=1 Tax=Kingdonia uniflora TaxID=39325 RepID=A0A7J7M3Z1_9MAGN|nr:hypothetical protein GIB67_011202 [Kingdonia uniflora]